MSPPALDANLRGHCPVRRIFNRSYWWKRTSTSPLKPGRLLKKSDSSRKFLKKPESKRVHPGIKVEPKCVFQQPVRMSASRINISATRLSSKKTHKKDRSQPAICARQLDVPLRPLSRRAALCRHEDAVGTRPGSATPRS